MILEKIKKPNDIHKIPLEDFEPLAAEIRDFLIRSVSQTGGHLASNLGVVELTLALHNVLDFPEDKLLWDVGHIHIRFLPEEKMNLRTCDRKVD